MAVETRLGLEFADRNYSPQKAERLLRLNNHHHFPQNRREFLEVLIKEIPALPLDWLRLWNDFTRGLIERRALSREVSSNHLDSTGDGSLVVIAGGYGSFDWWYYPAFDFFAKKGHLPVMISPEFIVNDEPIERKKARYMRFVQDLAAKSGQKVHFVGDSQGGLTAAAMAVDYQKEFQESVQDVWFIGAPKPWKVNVVVGIAYLWSQMWYRGNDFRLAARLEKLAEIEAEGKVPFRSIYRREDVVLPDGLPIGEHFSTEGSHFGGAVNLRHLNLMVSTWAKRESSADWL